MEEWPERRLFHFQSTGFFVKKNLSRKGCFRRTELAVKKEARPDWHQDRPKLVIRGPVL